MGELAPDSRVLVVSEEQFAFDIEGMLHEAAVAAAPEWSGAPLHFTTAHHSPIELDEAFAHWKFLHHLDRSWTGSRMWHRGITPSSGNGHGFDFFTADLRCEPWEHPASGQGCQCVGELMYQTICAPCEWRDITNSENRAVEAWHDHAFPGWRQLPILPLGLRGTDEPGISKSAAAWIRDRYPVSMQVPGAPVITERLPMGTRHVPGRSPWKGYDISHTAVDPERLVEAPVRRAPGVASPTVAHVEKPVGGLGL